MEVGVVGGLRRSERVVWLTHSFAAHLREQMREDLVVTLPVGRLTGLSQVKLAVRGGDGADRSA